MVLKLHAVPEGRAAAIGLRGNLSLLMRNMEIDFKEMLMSSLVDATLNLNHWITDGKVL